ncbi:hypothetical protein P7C70_g6543, partial [Phenoliferia sp. Uapishka_3]
MSNPPRPSGRAPHNVHFGTDQGSHNDELAPDNDLSDTTAPLRTRYLPPAIDTSVPRNPPPAALPSSQSISDPFRHSSSVRSAAYGQDLIDTSPLSPRPLGRSSRVTPAPNRGTGDTFAYPSSLPRRNSQDTLYDESPYNAEKGGTPRKSSTSEPLDSNGRPRRPSLRRESTEEHIRRLAARQAIDIVNSHTRGDFAPRRRRPTSPAPRSEDEELGLPRDHERAAGVLSHLLRLYGQQQAAGLRRSASLHEDSSAEGETGPLRGRGEAPRLRRSRSDNSVATNFFEDDLVDPYDPSNRKKRDDGTEMDRRRSYSDDGALDEGIKKRRTAKPAQREDKVYDAMKGKGAPPPSGGELHITAHVADILQRQNFILKLAKALMTFGAPSHRLESQLNATAKVLDVDAQFVHIPSVVMASFGDADTHTSETKFVKASGGLNLGMLHDVHGIYRAVVSDEIGVEEGSIALTRMLQAEPIYNLWQRMIIAAMCAGIIAPLGFGGSFVDALVSGAFGAGLAFLQLHAAKKNAIFSNIFEISVAALISFISRGLSTTDYFCYEALSSAGVVLVLPGYIILCGSLELASKNLVAGSVRMVYAIIYTLFLGFSISVGSDLFYLFMPSARAGTATTVVAATVMQGTFMSDNTTNSFMGTFSFTNTTTTASADTASLQKGNVMCARDPGWQWWRQNVNLYWLFFLVPGFSVALSLWNLQPIRSREMPVMVIIAIIGFVTNRLATQYPELALPQIFDRSDIVSFIGATVIGLLGNIYSRVFNGTSFTAMATGVLFLVPSGIAAAGGLAMSQSEGGGSYNSGLLIGFRMVQVAIGITIGLFFASFCVYSVGSKKGSGSMGFAF